MNIRKALVCIISAFFFAGCGDDEVKSPDFSFTERLNMDNMRNLNTIIESPDAHSGRNVSRVDSGRDFGLMYIYKVPDSLVGKQLAVSVDAWVKSGNLENPGDLICSITDGHDSILMWNGFGSKNVLKAPNQWANITSTLTIPRAATSKANTTISIIAYNSGKAYFDVDDLNIRYFEVNP